MFITLTFPAILVLSSVRLVASEIFLRIEYNRPGFPQDRYGFSREERLHYAPYAIDYLYNDAGINYLGDLTFEDGTSLYTAGELEHMEDVKTVMRAAMAAYTVLGLGYVIGLIVLTRSSNGRSHLRQALRDGGMLTVFWVITLVVLVFANWDFFFDGFHSVFFESGTWRFRNSDTLIRLFPEQFWLDAALTIGSLTVTGSIITITVTRWWERRDMRRPITQNGAENGSVEPRDDGVVPRR